MTDEEAPRRRPRRHRRVVAPATNAGPEDNPDFTEPHLDVELSDEAVTDGGPQVGTEDWWRAQRPPHWG